MLNFNNKLIICRHGETDWNKQHRVQGRQNTCLNEKGIIQAHELAKQLHNIKFDVIVCSSLDRAIKTAQIIADLYNIPVNECIKEFDERDFGIFEGKTAEQCKIIKEQISGKKSFFSPPETDEHFSSRVIKGLNYIYQKYPQQGILLVCHAGVMKVLYCYFNGIDDLKNCGYEPDNCSYIQF